jgi:Zn-dependent peptidase ImmA (M78 family)/transcriptional regulator with XRE-family HTH domain
VGKQVSKLRTAAGLKKTQLAEEVGLDPSAISRIEAGKRAVTMDELVNIADSLGVSPLAILEPNSLLARLRVAARSTTDQLDYTLHRRLTALAELDYLLSSGGIAKSVKEIPPETSEPETWLQTARRLAKWAREILDLAAGGDRLDQLASAIESKLGIDVLIEEHDPSSLGAAITDHEFPLILVNAAQPSNRALFTLAHELGHILADDRTNLLVHRSLSGTDDRERVANAFAAEFLLPEDEVKQYLKDWGGYAESLGKMMITFGVSWESLVYRLHNLRIIDAESRGRLLKIGFAGLLREVDDPGLLEKMVALRNLAKRRSPGLLEKRLWDGYQNGIVSIRPLAGLLGIDPEELLAHKSPRHSGPNAVTVPLNVETEQVQPDEELYSMEPF